jgi:hypothetical protein
VHTLITKKERQTLELQQNQNILVQFQKTVKGFKITAITSISIPLLFLPFLFALQCKQTHFNEEELLVIFILLFMDIEMLISSLYCILSYNYLFSTTNNTKVFYILFIPFIPIFLIGFFLILVGGGFIGIFLIIPYVIILAVMAKILYFKRKQFNAKQNT